MVRHRQRPRRGMAVAVRGASGAGRDRHRGSLSSRESDPAGRRPPSHGASRRRLARPVPSLGTGRPVLGLGPGPGLRLESLSLGERDSGRGTRAAPPRVGARARRDGASRGRPALRPRPRTRPAAGIALAGRARFRTWNARRAHARRAAAPPPRRRRAAKLRPAAPPAAGAGTSASAPRGAPRAPVRAGRPRAGGPRAGSRRGRRRRGRSPSRGWRSASSPPPP